MVRGCGLEEEVAAGSVAWERKWRRDVAWEEVAAGGVAWERK